MTQREQRLPKWAQIELTNLRRRNRQLQEQIEGATPADADTFVNDNGKYTGEARQGFPKGETVSFYTTTDTDDWNKRVDVRVQDGWVRIYGGRSLTILPESSNTIRLRSE